MSQGRKRVWAGGCGLVVAGLLAVALWLALVPTGRSEPRVVNAPTETVRTVLRDVPTVGEDPEPSEARPLDPTSIKMAIAGELGLSMRNRVCRVCLGGVLDDEACERCGYADAGRLVFDIVDLEGRPYSESATLVANCVERFALGPSGFVDLPPGTCKIAVLRFTSTFRTATEWIEVDIATNEETYQLFEVSNAPIGGVGVKLTYDVGSFRVIDLIGAYAGGRIPIGAEILAIDGQPAGLPDVPEHADPRSSLPGPVGSEVEVRIGYESESGWVEETVVLERHAIGTHEIGLGGTPG